MAQHHQGHPFVATIASLVWLLPKQQQQAGSNTTKWPEFVPNQSWAAHGGEAQPPRSRKCSHKVRQRATDTTKSVKEPQIQPHIQ